MSLPQGASVEVAALQSVLQSELDARNSLVSALEQELESQRAAQRKLTDLASQASKQMEAILELHANLTRAKASDAQTSDPKPSVQVGAAAVDDDAFKPATQDLDGMMDDGYGGAYNVANVEDEYVP